MKRRVAKKRAAIRAKIARRRKAWWLRQPLIWRVQEEGKDMSAFARALDRIRHATFDVVYPMKT